MHWLAKRRSQSRIELVSDMGGFGDDSQDLGLMLRLLISMGDDWSRLGPNGSHARYFSFGGGESLV